LRIGAVAVLALLLAAPAAAHETLHEVRRDNAISLRAYFADGEVLAHAGYEIYSPLDPRKPHQEGRTDRNGWLAFVPDAPGRWRVRVMDQAGHGLDLLVDAQAQGGSPPVQAPAAGAVSPAAFLLRPLLALAVIGAVFAALFLAYRRRGGTP
jgi:nickel transport protein